MNWITKKKPDNTDEVLVKDAKGSFAVAWWNRKIDEWVLDKGMLTTTGDEDIIFDTKIVAWKPFKH